MPASADGSAPAPDSRPEDPFLSKRKADLSQSRRSADRAGRPPHGPAATESPRAQMLWTLFVALVIGLVALQHTLSPSLSGGRGPAADPAADARSRDAVSTTVEGQLPEALRSARPLESTVTGR